MKRIIVIFFIASILGPLSVLADTTTGADMFFDVNPKSVSMDSQNVSLTIKATIYDSAYLSYCGVNVTQFRWGVYEIIPNQSDQKIIDEYRAYTPYDYNTDRFDLSRQITLSSSTNQNRQFYAVVRCYSPVNTLGHDQVTKSATISVTQQISNSGGNVSGNNNKVNPGADLSFPNPLQTGTVAELLNGILNFAMAIGIPIAVVMIVYAGIMFLISQGNPGQITKARSILMYAVIGLAVILIGKGFLTLIQSILDLANG